MGAYFFLVPLPGGLVIDVEVCHFDAELAGVKPSGLLNPFDLMTIDVVEEIWAAGLGKFLEEKGKLALLVKFDAFLSESVDLFPIILHIS